MEKRILFVVRDRAMREHLAQTFCGRGFRVITASDGVGGLFQFGLRQPHLVVLDVNGWETLQRIRTLSDIPVIVLVEDTPEARIECLDRGPTIFWSSHRVWASLKQGPVFCCGGSLPCSPVRLRWRSGYIYGFEHSFRDLSMGRASLCARVCKGCMQCDGQHCTSRIR